jgi:hypothetical protein
LGVPHPDKTVLVKKIPPVASNVVVLGDPFGPGPSVVPIHGENYLGEAELFGVVVVLNPGTIPGGHHPSDRTRRSSEVKGLGSVLGGMVVRPGGLVSRLKRTVTFPVEKVLSVFLDGGSPHRTEQVFFL